MGTATTTVAERLSSRTVLPWVVLGVGILASFLLFILVRNNIHSGAESRFERQVGEAKGVIEARIHSYADVLYGMRALFATHGPVDRAQFRRFVDPLDLKNRYPGFEVVSYAAHVRAEDKRHFEESVSRDTSLEPGGYPRFAIKPPGKRSSYHVLVYLEPWAANEFAFGLDITANPHVAAAQASSRDPGELT